MSLALMSGRGKPSNAAGHEKLYLLLSLVVILMTIQPVVQIFALLALLQRSACAPSKNVLNSLKIKEEVKEFKKSDYARARGLRLSR
jgi:hypothetical protein